jgi:hypothetical protein
VDHKSAEHIEFKRIRPRIHLESGLHPDEVIERIARLLSDDRCNCEGHYRRNYATITIPEEEQHLWSPQLTITLEKTDSGSLVRGLYGPKPSIWTMFFFFYAFIAFAAMIIGMIGLSFWSLGKPAPILWLVPILAVVFLSLYLVAYSGQKLGHKQIVKLHRFIEEVLGEEVQML